MGTLTFLIQWYLGGRALAAVPVVHVPRAQVRLEPDKALLVVKVARARVELGVHARRLLGGVLRFACNGAVGTAPVRVSVPHDTQRDSPRTTHRTRAG